MTKYPALIKIAVRKNRMITPKFLKLLMELASNVVDMQRPRSLLWIVASAV